MSIPKLTQYLEMLKNHQISLQDVLYTFKTDTSVHQNLNYFNLWLQFANLQPQPIDIYHYMEQRNIGTSFAQLYIEMAKIYQQYQKHEKVKKWLLQGIERGAEPKRDLEVFLEQHLSQMNQKQKLKEELFMNVSLFKQNDEWLQLEEVKARLPQYIFTTTTTTNNNNQYINILKHQPQIQIHSEDEDSDLDSNNPITSVSIMGNLKDDEIERTCTIVQSVPVQKLLFGQKTEVYCDNEENVRPLLLSKSGDRKVLGVKTVDSVKSLERKPLGEKSVQSQSQSVVQSVVPPQSVQPVVQSVVQPPLESPYRQPLAENHPYPKMLDIMTPIAEMSAEYKSNTTISTSSRSHPSTHYSMYSSTQHSQHMSELLSTIPEYDFDLHTTSHTSHTTHSATTTHNNNHTFIMPDLHSTHTTHTHTTNNNNNTTTTEDDKLIHWPNHELIHQIIQQIKHSNQPPPKSLHDHSQQMSHRYPKLKKDFHSNSSSAVLELGHAEFRVRKKLGQGAYGAVYYCMNDQDQYAIKIEHNNSSSSTTSMNSCWEFYLLKQLELRLDPQQQLSFIKPHCFHLYKNESYLLLKYYPNGTLLDLINLCFQQEKYMDELLCLFYTRELLLILEALYLGEIVHADMKADNLLLRFNFNTSSTQYKQWLSDTSLLHHTTKDKQWWLSKGLCCLDFGRGVDLRLLDKEGDCQFYTRYRVKEKERLNVLEDRMRYAWSWDLDAVGVGGIIYLLLFGKYWELNTSSSTMSVEEWRPELYYKELERRQFKRSFDKEMWMGLLGLLLGKDWESYTEHLERIRAYRERMEERLCSSERQVKELLRLWMTRLGIQQLD